MYVLGIKYLHKKRRGGMKIGILSQGKNYYLYKWMTFSLFRCFKASIWSKAAAYINNGGAL